MNALMCIILILFTLMRENRKYAYGSPKRDAYSPALHNVERFKITSSPNDKCSYRGLKLKNDLRVVLVSDKSFKKSAAAMVVGVGGLNDFPGTPGLANLVAYSLIMGSKKYSVPYDFIQYIKSNLGNTELPVTRASEQIISFSVKHAAFEGALDRFAHLFIEPLFYHVSPEMLEDPIDIAHSHYERLGLFDEFRIAEVEKSVCKKNHPFCHYFIGNKNSFYQNSGEVEARISLHEKVLKFHSLWYSSNIMTLAVLGIETLDVLEEMVVPLFEKIENKNMKKLVFPYVFHPWGPEQLKKKIYIIPDDDIRLLRVSFPVLDVSDKYRTAPDQYISNLIIDAGAQSVCSMLIRADLGKTLKVLLSNRAGIGLLTIQVELTKNGAERSNEIINIIFQYIHLLREEGVQKWIFDEQRQIITKHFINWRSEDVDALSYSENLAYAMQTYPTEDILTYYYSRDEWNPSLIECFLSYLRPDNMNVSIVSQSLEKFADMVEPTYGTRYGVVEIPNELIEKWSKKETIPELQLPSSGEYLIPITDWYSAVEYEPKNPYIIHQSPIAEVWYKREKQFNVSIILAINSPVSRYGPGQRMLIYMYHTKLVAYLSRNLGPEIQTGLSWKITLESVDVRVKLYGVKDRLPLLLERILSLLSRFENRIVDDLENMRISLQLQAKSTRETFASDRPVQTSWYMHYLQMQGGWPLTSTAKDTERILQYANMRKFLSKIFRRVFIRALIFGNCTKQDAMGIVNIIEKAFQSSTGLVLQEILRPRAIEIAEGSQLLLRVFNGKHGTYAQNTTFQLIDDSTNSPRHKVLGFLFHHIVKTSCERILSQRPEKKSMVSRVDCVLTNLNGVEELNLTTVTVVKDAGNVNKKTERFLLEVPNLLRFLTDHEFRRIKTLVETTEFKKPSNLKELSEQYWNEINNRSYNFERNETEIEILRSVKNRHLMVYFKDMFNIPRRRQLTIEIFPRDKTTFSKSPIPNEVLEIKDIEDFKNASSLLPHNFRSVPVSGRKENLTHRN